VTTPFYGAATQTSNIRAFGAEPPGPRVQRRGSDRAYDGCVKESATPGFVPRPVRTRSAAQQIADQIRGGILGGELTPGERLPSELDLADEFRVSRGTIRETMKILGAAQLVQPTRGAGGGTFVRLPDPDVLAASVGETLALWFNAGSTTMEEVEAARAWIEEGCVRSAAEVRDEHDLAAIRRAVEAMEPPPDNADDGLAIDLDFHIAVSRAAHNAVLGLAMTAIHLVRPHTNTVLLPYLDFTVIAQQHRAVFEGIAAGDADHAVDALRIHLGSLREMRARAVAARPELAVGLAALAAEAHPAVEVVRSRILGDEPGR
jgi:GntR family transcriptional regulator, transcriptional repressor for pyruvate dehydrogenase complex